MEDPLIRKTVGLRRSLLARIEDFRFGQRIKTEAEAIRQVLDRGLRASEPRKGQASARGE